MGIGKFMCEYIGEDGINIGHVILLLFIFVGIPSVFIIGCYGLYLLGTGISIRDSDIFIPNYLILSFTILTSLGILYILFELFIKILEIRVFKCKRR